MKTYSNKSVAEKIVEKLQAQGKIAELKQAGNGWQVVETNAPSAEVQAQLDEIVTEQAVAQEAPAASKPSKPELEGDITFQMPASRETPEHVISDSFMGRERWIRKVEMKSFEIKNGVATITMPRRSLLGRGEMKQLLKTA